MTNPEQAIGKSHEVMVGSRKKNIAKRVNSDMCMLRIRR